MQKTKEICGNSIILHPLNTDNREEYLKVFKRASAFSELCAASEDLWRTMSEPIGTDNDTTVRYIIYVKDAVLCIVFRQYVEIILAFGATAFILLYLL